MGNFISSAFGFVSEFLKKLVNQNVKLLPFSSVLFAQFEIKILVLKSTIRIHSAKKVSRYLTIVI